MATELLTANTFEPRSPQPPRWLRRLGLLVAMSLVFALLAFASDADRKVLIRDVTQIQGVRDNQLVGYGLAIGLKNTGDTQQTFFTVQTLANSLQRMGVQIAPGVVVVKNVAAVFVTATLPPFARPGMKIDITVSSVGDAKSIQGGVLLLTALRAANGEVYAEAQGPLVIGGYSEGAAGNTKSVNQPTVGRIAEGATVERDAAVDLSHFRTVSLLLQNSDFTAARDVADVINKEFDKPIATALDSRRIDVDVAASGAPSVPILISRIQNLSISFRSPAKVVVNERTGTIVMGGDVRLSPVSVIQGSLTIDVETRHVVVQPAPLSNGKAEVVDETKTTVNDAPAQSIQLEEGANVDELIKGLHAIGATSHDIISILQAIKAAGGLEADLEVI
ncbi:MAG: flagellar basal body P-ring protein FlgI [Terracidiphilus sp.]|jgi:flagellar P-ring protein precursor FlgI